MKIKEVKEVKKYYLQPCTDSHISFYQKAYVLTNCDFIKLYSYDTFIVSLDRKNKKIIYSNYWDYSKTTLRHLKEFLRQEDNFFKKCNIPILKDYSKKSIEKLFKNYGILEA